MILVFKHIIPKQFIGLTVWPFVFVKEEQLKNDAVLINHEAIHLRQQLELLIFPFFIWYTLEFLWKLLLYKDRYLAYKNISFEREAYDNESDLNYLNTRKWYYFIHYLNKKRH